MQFSLLKWPDQIPSRMPLSRGLPSASASAVSTGGVPNALPLDIPRAVPQAEINPDAFALPYQAVARFAAVGGEVSQRTAEIVLAAEAKKREADDAAAISTLTLQSSLKLDNGLEELKTSTDHTTFRSAYNKLFAEITKDAVANAPNANVSRGLQLKLLGLQVAKGAEVANVQRVKTMDYYGATLEENSKGIARMIVDPNATDADRDYQIKQAEGLYQAYGHMGFPLEKINQIRERTLTTSYGTLAQQDLIRNPEQFLPKSDENPNGGDGWKKYSATSKYPADPKYLNTLIDTTGPNLLAHRSAMKRQADTDREAAMKTQLTDAWGSKYEQLQDDLHGDDPAKAAAAAAEADLLLRDNSAGPFWTHGMRGELRIGITTTRRAGGTTVDARYNDLESRILQNPDAVNPDEIRKWSGKELAITGDRSARTLIELQRQLQKTDDVSHRPDYQQGHEIILTLSAGPTDMMALMSSSQALFKPENIERNRTLFGNALREYNTKARSAEWKDKDLGDLAIQIRDKYMPLIYGPMKTLPSTSGGRSAPKPKLEGN